MATTTPTETHLQRWRFTVDDYHRMGEAGILDEDDRVELIEGEIIAMSPIGARHIGCIIDLTQLLVPRVSEIAIVSIQNPVRLGPRLEPQPDVVLLRRRQGPRRREMPTAADVLLLIEVADSSLAYDRAVKLPLYARSGIPEVWIVDLAGNAVEPCADPAGDIYPSSDRFHCGETITSLTLPSLLLDVEAVLG